MLTLFFVRPILALLLFISILGWGWLSGQFFKRSASDLLSLFCTGVAVCIGLLFALGLSHAYQPVAFWSLFIVGLISGSRCLFLKRIEFKRLGGELKVRWPLSLAIALLSALMLVRSQAPPYFIDTLQYHFNICDQYLKAGGIFFLQDDFYCMAPTSFYPESFFLWAMALLDPMTATCFNSLLSLLLAFQLVSLLKRMGANRAISYGVSVFFFSETVFLNAVYAKNEPIMMLFALEFGRVLAAKEEGERPFYAGLMASFALLSKFSIVFIVGPLLVYALVRSLSKEGRGRVTAMASFGLIVGALPWLLRNGWTHGMWLYPFLVEPDKLPLYVLPETAGYLFTWDFSYVERSIKSMQALFLNMHQRGFRPFILPWVTLGLLVAFPVKKILPYALLILGLLNWAIWVFPYRWIYHSYRLSFPGWVVILIASALILQSIRSDWFVKSVTWLTGGLSFCILLSIHGLFLPGYNYHLGKQSLEQYYDSLYQKYCARSCSSLITSLPKDSKIAVLGSSFPVKHPGAFSFTYSLDFTEKTLKDYKAFKAMLLTKGYDYAYVDRKLCTLSQAMRQHSKHEWIEFFLQGQSPGLISVGPYHILYDLHADD